MMEILKDFLGQVPLIFRIIAYVIGLVFWTWFVFFYPTNMRKDGIKDSSYVKSETKIGTVEGDYVAGNKYVTETHKPEISSEAKQKLEKENDPLVDVRIERAEKELLMKIKARKHVNTLAIDIPVLGKITNIHDYNSITDAQTSLKQITGSQTAISQNNVEFLIENIKPNVNLSYKILFEPINKGIYIAGSDRYKISYTWEFEGNISTKEKWISLETNKEVGRPAVEVKRFTFTNRVLTPEEIRKRYEQGFPKQKIE